MSAKKITAIPSSKGASSQNNSSEARQSMINIMSQNEAFIIIGLTGRIGSGCSKATSVFSADYQDLELAQEQPGADGFKNDEERDRRIIQRFAKAHWLPFDVLKTRTIITTFLLEQFNDFIKAINSLSRTSAEKTSSIVSFENEVWNAMKTEVKEVIEPLLPIFEASGYTPIVSDSSETLIDVLCESDEKVLFYDAASGVLKDLLEKLSNKPSDVAKGKKLAKKTNRSNFCSVDNILASPLLDIASELFECFGLSYNAINGKLDESVRREVVTDIEKPLKQVAAILACYLICEGYQSKSDREKNVLFSKNKKNDFWNLLSEVNSLLEEIHPQNQTSTHESATTEKFDEAKVRVLGFVFVHDIMPMVGNAIRNALGTIEGYESAYTKLYQKFGNSIRRNGKIVLTEKTLPPSAGDVFTMPRKMVQFIKMLRHPFSSQTHTNRDVRVVIDSIKNAYEANYLRQRYSSFYLFSLSAKDEVRKSRLMNREAKKMTIKEIRHVDWNEYSEEGAKHFRRIDDKIKGEEKRLKEDNHYNEASEAALTSYKGKQKKRFPEAYENNLSQFYLQDVATSIENADVFISSNHEGNTKDSNLILEIVRNVSLIMFPGLLVPTPIERCMQIAYSAKGNSGCLSRQVGAVVTDKDYNILSVGWNDVPCGEVSCSRKNLIDLCRFEDRGAYSLYELESPEFRERLNEFDYKFPNFHEYLSGLPMRYCFKDIHKDGEKNPMRARAMHAEEKALAHVGLEAEGGCLFTTSSPCEMCSKNAKNHKIKKIYYIELYPGISETHYTQSGDKNNIAEHILFSGAVGRAYTQMYYSIMPQKDILEMLGIYDKCQKSKR